ncbi:hypothetical protein HYS48_00365 [Candidatus Woesearchaeota archaeon]|nr:hypothetical protein [Candidatus Woesearchaeota archaeon]
MCGARTEFCNIEIDEKQAATENNYTCPADCKSACDVDFTLTICEMRDGVYKIQPQDKKGNIEYITHLYKGKRMNFFSVIFMTEGSMNWNTNTFTQVTGEMQEISFMPKVKNELGAVMDCVNGEVIVKAADIQEC